jgi:hypothetical protein
MGTKFNTDGGPKDIHGYMWLPRNPAAPRPNLAAGHVSHSGLIYRVSVAHSFTSEQKEVRSRTYCVKRDVWKWLKSASVGEAFKLRWALPRFRLVHDKFPTVQFKNSSLHSESNVADAMPGC